MDFNYGSSFGAVPRRPTRRCWSTPWLATRRCYTRQDMVEASWAAVQPILDHRRNPAEGVPNYPGRYLGAGSRR